MPDRAIDPDSEPTRATAPPPFARQRVDHVVLRVRDIERAVGSCRAVPGREVARHNATLGLVNGNTIALEGPAVPASAAAG